MPATQTPKGNRFHRRNSCVCVQYGAEWAIFFIITVLRFYSTEACLPYYVLRIFIYFDHRVGYFNYEANL